MISKFSEPFDRVNLPIFRLGSCPLSKETSLLPCS
nr:MAG TPA: toxin [Caudoviricetes sp.]DAW46942.1 MAG TPA: toxin [Caudoviricetes sp.]